MVYFDGKDLATISEGALARERTRFGFVFQQAALVRQHDDRPERGLPVAAAHAEGPGGDSRALVITRLAEVGLPDTVMNKKPAELSGGMRKRVGLARALALEPEVVLYDEPTTGLDPIMSDVINELIVETRQHHPVTSVVVTHDMRTVQKVSDRTIMLYPARSVARRGAADPVRRELRRLGAVARPAREAIHPRRSG